jgi:hypothetical protein
MGLVGCYLTNPFVIVVLTFVSMIKIILIMCVWIGQVARELQGAEMKEIIWEVSPTKSGKRELNPKKFTEEGTGTPYTLLPYNAHTCIYLHCKCMPYERSSTKKLMK